MIQSVNLTENKFTKYDYCHSTFFTQIVLLTVIFVFLLTMKLSYPKKEKLKGKKLIEKLFVEGSAITLFPFKLIYISVNTNNKCGVSVSKKNFKKAVNRNRIKRLIREAYRYNKSLLIDNNVEGYAFMILYIAKDLPDYKSLNNKIKLLLTKFISRLSE